VKVEFEEGKDFGDCQFDLAGTQGGLEFKDFVQKDSGELTIGELIDAVGGLAEVVFVLFQQYFQQSYHRDSVFVVSFDGLSGYLIDLVGLVQKLSPECLHSVEL
jgi:hypothetical protein